MSKATIEGKISSTGHLRLYYTRNVSGEFDPYDIVIMPKDENGAISFTLPQGTNVTIELYSKENGKMEVKKTVTIPMSDRVALSDLLK